jgi:hypothetical protein
MKSTFILILIFLTLALASCDFSTNDDNIAGKWKGQHEEDGTMIFHKNGTFEVLDKDGQSVFVGDPAFDGESKPSMTWETITEVEPHQLYIIIPTENGSMRIPWGIYKIVNNKLIHRHAIDHSRTIGGFFEYEIPKDFSGIVRIFERIE